MPASIPLISSHFDSSATADDVVAGLDLHGLRAIVTGASSGIGVETARSLARAGAEVTLAVRNTTAATRTAHDIARSTGNGTVVVSVLDLADQASVAEFARRWTGPLHLLINNAGVITADHQRTPEGWELQFATNHLGHFALTNGLHAALADGAAERGEARIVSLSSTAHMRSPVVFDDIHFAHRDYDPQAAYSQSKTANSLFAVEASRRWADDGVGADIGGEVDVVAGHSEEHRPQVVARRQRPGRLRRLGPDGRRVCLRPVRAQLASSRLARSKWVLRTAAGVLPSP